MQSGSAASSVVGSSAIEEKARSEQACKHCGGDLPINAKFCSTCGTKVNTSTSHFPWWECEGKSGTYHLRTRLPGDEVGLLVDPGAHDNLVGSRTMEKMIQSAQASGYDVLTRPLTTPMRVEGVGTGSQAAANSSQVQIGINGDLGTYTAPVIPDSDLPPLLGLRTLRSQRAILDMSGPEAELILPGPGGFKLQLSPGSVRLPLKAAPSGHLILPVTNYPRSKSEPARNRYTFVADRARGR